MKQTLERMLGVEVGSIFCNFAIYYSVAGASARGLKAASIARQRRQKLGLQWNWYMLNIMSKGLIMTLDAPLTEYSHIVALDNARSPKPLYGLVPWLAKHWGEWMQRASTIHELCDLNLPILTSSLAVHCLNSMSGRYIYAHTAIHWTF
jgi:hypothetical protein